MRKRNETHVRWGALLSWLPAMALIVLVVLAFTVPADGETPMSNKKVLIILTSHDAMGNTGEKTGYYLEELTHPLFVLLDAGYTVDVASPKGGKAPMDPRSLKPEDKSNKRFLDDKKLVSLIDNTRKLSEIKPQEYAAILFPGGHGPMWDLATDQTSEQLVREVFEKGGVIAAVCHGPAGIANVKLSDGSYLVNGKTVTSFTNDEETAMKLEKVVPFALESKLVEHGAKFEKSPNFQEKVVVDGRLITGQNPASAEGLGKALANSLSTATASR